MAIVRNWDYTERPSQQFFSIEAAERRISGVGHGALVIAHASETFGRIARRRGRDEARVVEDRAWAALLVASATLLRENDFVIHEPETDVFVVVLSSVDDPSDPVEFAYVAESIERRLRAALDVDAYGGWTVARPGHLAEAVEEALLRGRLEGDRRRLATGLHDLLTPVAAISSVLSSVADCALDADTQRYFVSVALHESFRVSRMIRGLVSVERVSALSDVTDVRASIAYAVDAVAALAAARHVRIAICTEESCRVNLDCDGLSAVLVNLLDNAIKYGHERGKIEIHVGARGAVCRIDVDDDGPGIPRDCYQQVFDPGIRLANQGFGLGLASVRALVESVAGTVAVESSHLGGARLRLELPLAC